MNTLKTGVLLVLLSVLLVGIGSLVGGTQGATVALGFALLMNLGAYWFSDKIVLAMYRAKSLTEPDGPQVYRVMREIASRTQLPMPKLYWIPTATPNAFATGRSPRHASVAVTSGLLELLNEQELKGVLAHELSQREEPGHPGDDDRRRHRRGDHVVGGHGPVESVDGWLTPQPRAAWGRSGPGAGPAPGGDPRPPGGHADPAGHLPHARVWGG